MATVAEVAPEREVQSLSSQESEARSQKNAGKASGTNSDLAAKMVEKRGPGGETTERPVQEAAAKLQELPQPNPATDNDAIEKVEAKAEKDENGV